MFLKRKTVAVKFDDAIETLDGDEKKLDYLLKFGVVVKVGDTLEQDDAYMRFFVFSWQNIRILILRRWDSLLGGIMSCYRISDKCLIMAVIGRFTIYYN